MIIHHISYTCKHLAGEVWNLDVLINYHATQVNIVVSFRPAPTVALFLACGPRFFWIML